MLCKTCLQTDEAGAKYVGPSYTPTLNGAFLLSLFAMLVFWVRLFFGKLGPVAKSLEPSRRSLQNELDTSEL